MSLAATTSTSPAPVTAGTPAAAAASVAGNSIAGDFSTFLTLLTTQLQNQDPTAPLDTNQFTSQLVQFASVEQQINANTNLQTLISLGSAGALYQASAMVGHMVAVESPQMPLQNGAGALQYTLANAQNVDISVVNASGVELYRAAVAGAQGANTWAWDGKAASGNAQPDGAYTVKVTASDGAKAPVPFTVLGTATAVTTSGQTPSLSLGALTVPMSAVRSVIN
ncbi:MAG: flagellar biosynthesis protein FlgD [Alphaproteobacteria bacterium]|nr:flagellar biosynthesis protein FlgD [Alphaproteobacteria bacterium]